MDGGVDTASKYVGVDNGVLESLEFIESYLLTRCSVVESYLDDFFCLAHLSMAYVITT